MSEDHLRPVLLVEDNADDAELTIRGLKRANLPNPVDVARDGQEALDYLFATGEQVRKREPCFVLLDLKLPRIDGLEVLNRIRAKQRTRLTPVVILTSSSEDGDLINAYHLGANGYVCKPIQLDEFTGAIEQLGLYWLTINQPPPSADDDTPAAATPAPNARPADGASISRANGCGAVPTSGRRPIRARWRSRRCYLSGLTGLLWCSADTVAFSCVTVCRSRPRAQVFVLGARRRSSSVTENSLASCLTDLCARALHDRSWAPLCFGMQMPLISGIVVTDEGTKKLCKDVNDRNVETFKARWSSVLTSRGTPSGESGIAETGLSGVLDLR